MYFWCICGEEGDLHVLLPCHLEGAPLLLFKKGIIFHFVCVCVFVYLWSPNPLLLGEAGSREFPPCYVALHGGLCARGQSLSPALWGAALVYSQGCPCARSGLLLCLLQSCGTRKCKPCWLVRGRQCVGVSQIVSGFLLELITPCVAVQSVCLWEEASCVIILVDILSFEVLFPLPGAVSSLCFPGTGSIWWFSP